MGFGELSVGYIQSIYNQSSNVLYSDTGKSYFKESIANGFSVRMQLSFVDWWKNRDSRRWEWADILAGQMAVGYIAKKDEAWKGAFWYSYMFDAGVGSKFKITPNHDIGLNVILLKVGTDFQGTYFIGSNVTLRHRLFRWQQDVSVETRQDRFLGIFWIFQGWYYNPLQITWQVKYLLDGQRQLGLKVEYYSSSLTRHLEKVPLLENQVTWRIFYGKYF